MPKCEIYTDLKGEWRWRKVSNKGEIEAYAKEGFKSREEAEENGKESGACTSYKVV